jgi:hypothetical protein
MEFSAGSQLLEGADTDLKTIPFDHHGVIAPVCKDLQIFDRIDCLLPGHDARVVCPGRAVVALILNSLGFTNRRLYLTPQYFASKPVECLLEAPIQARTSMTIHWGMALDDLSDYGFSRLFCTVAFGLTLDRPAQESGNGNEMVPQYQVDGWFAPKKGASPVQVKTYPNRNP